jgi:two-component sensor histidine kinase
MWDFAMSEERRHLFVLWHPWEKIDPADRFRALEIAAEIIFPDKSAVTWKQNTLATVQAIVSQTLRTADNMEEAQGAIEQRLRSLGRVHDLLLRTSWVQANLHAILIAATQPFRTNEATQFQIDCPRILMVTAGAALPTAMVLNELCTNATKYGALSTPEGRVHIITAEVDESRKAARLTWRESGGPL